VFNVMMGEYKVMTDEFSDLMLGYYGETIAEKDPEVVAKAKEFSKKEAITCRPADLLQPEWETLQADAGKLEGADGSDEDVLTYAMFPQVAPKFFRERAQGPKNLATDPTPAIDPSHKGVLNAPINYEVTINGKKQKVTVAPV
jgi:methylmalonyl-CoA carboxyltransferase 5S subunit